jgi:hypothetical protein
VLRRVEAGAVVLAAGLLGALPANAAGADTSAPRRGDAKVYHVLKETKRQRPLDRGETDRTIALVQWRPLPRASDDPARDEPEPRRQILDATCDAHLVVLARVASAVPFQHPNGRWVATAHDLDVTRVVRARGAMARPPQRLHYVHPSGELTVGGRTVRTTVDRLPLLATDEEGLFFLIPIGRGAYRTSLLLPPMALRGGVLDAFGPVPATTVREPASGMGARDAVRAAFDAVCRPAPVERRWRPASGDGRLPPLTPRLDTPP